MPVKPRDDEELLQRGYRYALSLAHDSAVAEDLLHDAWLACQGKRGVNAPVSYLFTAIRHRFIDSKRRDTRFPRVSLEAVPAAELSAEDEGFDAVTSVDLDRALEVLKVEERELIFLTAVEGYTVSEAAELTGRPIGTVSSWIQRGKAKLRSALAGRGRKAAL